MTITELMRELQKILDEHGDLPVFSRADYEWVASAVFVPEGYVDDKPDHVALDW